MSQLSVTATPQDLDLRIQALKEELADLVHERLNMHIQALPQELQDAILALTVAVEPAEDGIIYIDPAYKPPIGLQLNRKIRATFAPVYYGDSIFLYTSYLDSRPQGRVCKLHVLPSRSGASVRSLKFWLESLESVHRAFISTIRLDWEISTSKYAPGSQIHQGSKWLRWWAERESYILYMNRNRNPINDNVLVFPLRSPDGEVEWYRTNTNVSITDHRRILDATP